MLRPLLLVTVLLLPVGSAQAQTILSDSRSTLESGVRLASGEVRLTNGDRTRWDATFTSLCTDYVHVDARAPATSPRTTGSWGSAVGATVAVNGDFYRSTSGNWHVYGDAVGGGRAWPNRNTGNAYSSGWYHHDYGWIAFGPGWVEFSHSRYVKNNAAAFGATLGWSHDSFTEDIPNGTTALVSGFSELVIEGTPYSCPDVNGSCFPDRSDMRDRHPRTAMGLSEDRRTFILLTVDGRTSSTSGATGEELASIIHQLGAWQAFNLDGGGSSSMWASGRGYVNHLSDGSARSVMNHWGVFGGSGSGRSRTPGSCFTAGGCYPTRVAGAEGETFKDLPRGANGYEAANILFREGVTNGCRSSPERYFCPRCQIDRRQFVTLLIKAAGIAHPAVASSPFSDVADDDWALPFIAAAAREGITRGCGGDRFCPDDPVTRGQAAAMIVRATGWSAMVPSSPSYGDVPSDHLFYRDIETIRAMCVTNGCGSGNYCPERAMNRAGVAVFLAKAFDLEDYNACIGGDPMGPGPGPDPDPDPDPGTGDGGVEMMTPADGGSEPSFGDGGVLPSRDAGSGGGGPSGGAPDGSVTGGCDASGAGGLAAWPLGLALLLSFRRRRR